MKPHTTLRWARAYSQKSDPALIADALGLLSPKRAPKTAARAPQHNYKPLIFRYLQKGPVTEHYDEIRAELSPELTLPTKDHTQLISALLLDLQTATKTASNKVDVQNIRAHVKTLESEDELVELATLSYYQHALTLPLLVQFVLNKNLRELSRLPFDVMNLDRAQFVRNGWTELNFVEFRIVLFKKLYDLNKPLLIVKHLRKHIAEFLALIEAGKLAPLYERIVWKFYFEYLAPNGETDVVERLKSLRTCFLIWEASTANSARVVDKLLAQCQLNGLQKLFLLLVPITQALVAHELELKGRSPLLSALKKISAKHKLYSVDSTDSVVGRATKYAVLNKLERLVKTQVPNWTELPQLVAFMDEVRSQRSAMSELDIPELAHLLQCAN